MVAFRRLDDEAQGFSGFRIAQKIAAPRNSRGRLRVASWLAALAHIPFRTPLPGGAAFAGLTFWASLAWRARQASIPLFSRGAGGAGGADRAGRSAITIETRRTFGAGATAGTLRAGWSAQSQKLDGRRTHRAAPSIVRPASPKRFSRARAWA